MKGVEAAGALLEAYGNVQQLAHESAGGLSRDKGMTPTRAARVVAGVALGRRIIHAAARGRLRDWLAAPASPGDPRNPRREASPTPSSGSAWCRVLVDVRLEPTGAVAEPALATGQYADTLELPSALDLLAVAGKLPVDRLADIVAVGGLDPCAVNESVGVRCVGAGGTTAIDHAAQTRGLRLIVTEDQAAAATPSAARRPAPGR